MSLIRSAFTSLLELQGANRRVTRSMARAISSNTTTTTTPFSSINRPLTRSAVLQNASAVILFPPLLSERALRKSPRKRSSFIDLTGPEPVEVQTEPEPVPVPESIEVPVEPVPEPIVVSVEPAPESDKVSVEPALAPVPALVPEPAPRYVSFSFIHSSNSIMLLITNFCSCTDQ